MTLTEDHIKKLLELEAKATPRRWMRYPEYSNNPHSVVIATSKLTIASCQSKEDIAFIAESRNIFRELAEDWLRMKQKEVQK